jgi:hypothetical protein
MLSAHHKRDSNKTSKRSPASSDRPEWAVSANPSMISESRKIVQKISLILPIVRHCPGDKTICEIRRVYDALPLFKNCELL